MTDTTQELVYINHLGKLHAHSRYTYIHTRMHTHTHLHKHAAKPGTPAKALCTLGYKIVFAQTCVCVCVSIPEVTNN